MKLSEEDKGFLITAINHILDEYTNMNKVNRDKWNELKERIILDGEEEG